LVDKWLRGRLERHEIVKSSAKTLRTTLYGFAESYGNRPVERMGRGDIECWLAEQKGCRDTTRQARLSAVRCFCRWLVREGKVRRDPCADVCKIRRRRKVPVTFEDFEVLTLLEACPDARARLVVSLLFYLGLRCVEVSRLDMTDIGEDYVKITGKAGHERSLYIVPEVRSALRAYLSCERGGMGGPLIASRRDFGPLAANSVSKMVGQWIRGAGLKRFPYDGRSAHGGRRTAASGMLDSGAAIETVAAVLGHADLQTVQLYAKVRDSKLKDALLGVRYAQRVVSIEATA
jgi:integrase/recombinase XerD